MGDRHRPHRHAADVAEVHGFLRQALVERLGETGKSVRILYGGSVKPDNARELMAVPMSTARWSAGPASKPTIFSPSSRLAALDRLA